MSLLWATCKYLASVAHGPDAARASVQPPRGPSMRIPVDTHHLSAQWNPRVASRRLVIGLTVVCTHRAHYRGLADCNLSARLSVLAHPALHVVDKFGGRPVSLDGAMLSFHLINARYGRASSVLTYIKNLEEWGGVLSGDAMSAADSRGTSDAHMAVLCQSSYPAPPKPTPVTPRLRCWLHPHFRRQVHSLLLPLTLPAPTTPGRSIRNATMFDTGNRSRRSRPER